MTNESVRDASPAGAPVSAPSSSTSASPLRLVASPPAPFVATRARVEVPATCANLGPGFDCLALALRLSNRFEVTLRRDGEPDLLLAEGDPADLAQLGSSAEPRDNLFFVAFRRLCARQGVGAPGLLARAEVNLPPGRGLGSSATAVLAGLLAANALLGEPLTRDELLELAVECEPGRHADNVAAALFGGVVVTGVRCDEGRLHSLRLAHPPALRAALFIPDQPMSTPEGRALLPDAYSRADLTFNLGRVALLIAALGAGRFDLLAHAMEDRAHQPYRAQMFPALAPLIAAARAAGAYGACLSGGGSSVLALVGEQAPAVADALKAQARALGVPGRSLVAEIAGEGARVELLPPLAEAGDALALADLGGLTALNEPDELDEREEVAG